MSVLPLPFTVRLGPEAVLEKLIHAVESPGPRAHYYVTKPAYMLAWARRLFSARLMDRVMASQ